MNRLKYKSLNTNYILIIFQAYQEAFESQEDKEAYAARPHPEYDPEEQEVQDVKFHLLKLYCQRSHPLEVLLSPKTHTPDHLDHRCVLLTAKGPDVILVSPYLEDHLLFVPQTHGGKKL